MLLQARKIILLLPFLLMAISYQAYGEEARLIEVTNEVIIHRHQSGSDEAAQKDSRLAPNDEVETMAGASAKIQIGDRGAIDLKEKSKWKFSSYERHGEDVVIHSELLLGQLKAKFRNRKDDSIFEIITPTAVASVRGTAFRLHVYPMGGDFYTRIEVFEGGVMFSGLDRLNPEYLGPGESMVHMNGFMRKAADVVSEDLLVVQSEWWGEPEEEFRSETLPEWKKDKNDPVIEQAEFA